MVTSIEFLLSLVLLLCSFLSFFFVPSPMTGSFPFSSHLPSPFFFPPFFPCIISQASSPFTQTIKSSHPMQQTETLHLALVFLCPPPPPFSFSVSPIIQRTNPTPIALTRSQSL